MKTIEDSSIMLTGNFFISGKRMEDEHDFTGDRRLRFYRIAHGGQAAGGRVKVTPDSAGA